MPEDSLHNERLNSWKEIASYLGKDIRTAYRWRSRGLPVHYVPGGKGHGVFAYRNDVDVWLRNGGTDVLPVASTLDLSMASPLHAFPWLPRNAVRVGLGVAFAIIGAIALAVVYRGVHAIAAPKLLDIRGFRQLTNDGLQKEGLVTDGTHVYFGERKNGRLVLASSLVAGGDVEEIESPPGNAVPVDISNTEHTLLVLVDTGYWKERELWIVPIRGSPRRAGTIICHSAAWAANNPRIFYSSGTSVFVTADEGKTSELLGSFDLVPQQLRSSPDGSDIRFLLCNPTNSTCTPWKLFVSTDNEKPNAAPISMPLEKCCAFWTKSDRNGNYFATQVATGALGIWFIQGNGAAGQDEPIRLPTTVRSVDEIASADRRVFVNSTGELRDELLQFVPHSDSYTPFLPGISATYADFAADGKWITYVRSSDWTLWRSRPDGSAATMLYSGAEAVELPRYSPDGKRIAFLAKHIGRSWQIYIVPADGGVAQQASEGQDDQGAPTWSPDGTSLVYANVLCGEIRSCAIHRIDLATKQIETLSGSQGLRTARWSPDGRSVAALDPTKHSVLLFDFQTRQWRNLAESINGDDLVWSPDSHYLYANRQLGPHPGILRIPVGGGRIETIVDLQVLNRLSGQVFTWFSVTPDGSVLVDRKLQSSEIYALDLAR